VNGGAESEKIIYSRRRSLLTPWTVFDRKEGGPLGSHYRRGKDSSFSGGKLQISSLNVRLRKRESFDRAWSRGETIIAAD